MFDIFTVIVIVSAALVLFRAVKGPTVFDRILAVNLLGTKTIVILALIGFVFGRPHFMDLALVYALINFIGTIALLKYTEKGRLD
ncbi:monovalent cation/H+ antiporter complex subunit F [Limisalsivibrio acetivorans]|uniref:monovalent cation/H+ antiporter complex subunit F n=1 Tax=Limisalsivibrio acetivorans TaxID=1304888 RepID=UPI0003B4299D|nr:cation:proton antiporter [Limisalsivibrio acetivorans]